MAKNIAQEIIIPSKPNNFRITFLYTGQGDSSILSVPIGNNPEDYEFVLLDSDLDKEESEVNLVSLLTDLLGGKKLSKFINTHPHKDHIGGIKEIYDKIGIDEVWHSNHRPKGGNIDSFKEFEYVLKKVGKQNEYLLKGTNELNKIRNHDDSEKYYKLGVIDYQIFSPAEYVCDDIEEEESNESRIHEQCGVIKFIYKEKGVLFTGDAEKKAWKEHITDYHNRKLYANVITASHHGSRTAFKTDSEDKEPYTKHLDHVNAEYLVISAPKQKDSPHNHPHDDALKIYEDYFEKGKIFHLGERPFSLIVNIDELGNLTTIKDEKLISTYSKKASQNEEIEKNERAKALSFIASPARPHKK